MDDWFNGDDATYTIKVSVPDLDNIVQQRLVEAARIIEFHLDPEDVEVWEALMVVIPYFSNPDQKQDLENWNAPAEWINVVMGKDA